mmetsp:Transcript_25627/g.74143  ORF Transcript_25627/g.74143 Transcript_25627/m.74143 type:complete len:295 (-) Transcript_25627:460-1344(-)
MDLCICPLKFICQVGNDPAATCAQRMAQRYGATVKIGLAHIQLQLLGAGQKLSRKGLIDFHPVGVLDRRYARMFQRTEDGRDRSNAHHGRVATGHMIGRQPGQRRQILLLDGLLAGQDYRTSPIANARRRRGRHRTILLENRSELSNLIQGCLGTRMLIGVNNLRSLPTLHFDRCNLRIEHPRLLGLAPRLLTADGKFVAFLPGDAILLGQIFGRDAHRASSVHIGQSIPQSIAHLQLRAKIDAPPHGVAIDLEGCAAHVLRATADGQFGLSQQYRFSPLNDGLKSAAAQPIDG